MKRIVVLTVAAVLALGLSALGAVAAPTHAYATSHVVGNETEAARGTASKGSIPRCPDVDHWWRVSRAGSISIHGLYRVPVFTKEFLFV